MIRLLSSILEPFVVLVSEQQHMGIFLLVTVALGGGAAWLTGRAMAAAWRPWWHVLGFMLLIAAAVRFCTCRCSAGRCCRRISTWWTRRSAWPSAYWVSG